MCGDSPQLQLKRKKKPIRTDKNTLFPLSPSQKSADLARVRDNQRRSRARRKEYLQELETKYWTCEQVGVGASAEIQAAARQVVNENKRLRALLMKYGISSREINGEGEETASSSVVENLEAMLGKRRACGSGSGGTGGRGDVVAAESCEKSLVAIRYGHSQMPDRGLRQLQMKGTIPSPQSSGNGLRENGGSLAGNTSVLQQQQQHSEAHQQQQHQQQFATLRHTLPSQAPLPPQQNHAPIQSNTHIYATASASASSSSTSSNPDHIYATTSTYSPGSSSSLYGGNNNNNNYPDYCYTQNHQQQQNHQHNDFFVNNNLDIYSAAAAVPQHHQHQQNQHQQNQYQQQPNTSASCRDIADAIRCIRPSLTLQELDEEMGCHQLCDADGGGGGGGGSSCGGNGGGNGDCKVPHYKAFELMDRLSN